MNGTAGNGTLGMHHTDASNSLEPIDYKDELISNLSQDLDRAETRINIFKNANKELERRNDAFAKSIIDLEGQIGKLIDENSKLDKHIRGQHTRYLKVLDTNKWIVEENNKLTSRIDELETELGQLKVEKNRLASRNETLEMRTEKLNTTIELLESRLNRSSR